MCHDPAPRQQKRGRDFSWKSIEHRGGDPGFLLYVALLLNKRGNLYSGLTSLNFAINSTPTANWCVPLYKLPYLPLP